MQTVKAATVAVLCGVMVVPPALAMDGPMASDSKMKLPEEKPVGPLNQQQRVLHALNRFTFGPRPGDAAAVSKMGLEAWFVQQLQPEKISDGAFEERLKDFPAMQLTQQELVKKFPSQQMLRAMDYRGEGMPSDPIAHAIYADAEASYQAQRSKQEKGAAAAAGQAAGEEDMQDPSMKAGAAKKSGGDDSMQMDASMAAPAAKAAGVEAKKGKRDGVRKHSEPVTKMSDEEARAVLALDPDARFKKLLAMKPMESVSFRDSLRGYQKFMLTRGMTPQQSEVVAAMDRPTVVVGSEAMETRLLRDIYSERQLQTVMTDFWLNHFSVYARKNQNEPYMLPEYQRDVILPNALGGFEKLLVSTAMSPAMLMYLDNWESVGPHSVAAQRIGSYQGRGGFGGQIAQKLPKGINENYGRELMELHTLGVANAKNSNYTQQDVIEVAKCFTGWTILRPYGGGGQGQRFRRPGMMDDSSKEGQFVFDASRHEPGDKMVLGHKIKENGMMEGLEVLHILATSPATAQYVSLKLAQRFVSDTPPQAMVDRMAASFLKTNGNIKAVLLTMYHSPEFWSPAVYRAKVKTPLEFMVSALRASNAKVMNPLPLVAAMDRLGMPIYGMQTPNGYSWAADSWVSSNALIARMNFALVLSGGRMPGVRTNWPTLLGDDPGSGVTTNPTEQTEAQLEGMLLGQQAAARTRATVLDQFKNPVAQKTAQQNFNARPVADEENASMDAPGMLLRARLGSKKGGGGYGNNNLNFDQLANLPETPLDTMAGLLLGSPDFQRR
ncbi:MAG: DUF1800 domain-containing protein [Acidobacteriota bacterium]